MIWMLIKLNYYIFRRTAHHVMKKKNLSEWGLEKLPRLNEE